MLAAAPARSTASCGSTASPRPRPDVVGDAELLPFAPESLDLAVSVLALHAANDLPGALAQMRRALKPDGLFLAAFLGGDTLIELREAFATAEAEVTGGASPRVAPFTDVRTAGALMQRAGFALPVVDQDRHTVRYASALHLMRDLRAMGVTNVLIERDRRPLRRAVLMRTVEIYGERFADPDGRVRATFDIISLSGWAPHESQQQPLRPGSARLRLADALGTVERPPARRPDAEADERLRSAGGRTTTELLPPERGRLGGSQRRRARLAAPSIIARGRPPLAVEHFQGAALLGGRHVPNDAGWTEPVTTGSTGSTLLIAVAGSCAGNPPSRMTATPSQRHARSARRRRV